MICPKCGSEKTKSNGSVRGNKKAQCKECNYQFVLEKSERFIEERLVDVLEIETYKCVLPSKRHHAVGKETGRTSYIERFNRTLRHRVGRLVRKTLSFSRKSYWGCLALYSLLQSEFTNILFN